MSSRRLGAQTGSNLERREITAMDDLIDSIRDLSESWEGSREVCVASIHLDTVCEELESLGFAEKSKREYEDDWYYVRGEEGNGRTRLVITMPGIATEETS